MVLKPSNALKYIPFATSIVNAGIARSEIAKWKWSV